MVTITVDNTTGSHIDGSLHLRGLHNKSKAHQLSTSTKLWKSHDDIYTATQDIPNGLSLVRYLPSSPIDSSYQQFLKSTPAIRSYLIDETGSQLEISEMSKSKYTSPALGLAYKKKEDVAYTNPAFIDSKSSVSNEFDTKSTVTNVQDISFKTNGHPQTIGFEDDSKKEFNGSINGANIFETNGKSTPTAQVMPNVHFKDDNSDKYIDSVKIDMMEDVGNQSNGSAEFPRSAPDAEVPSKIIHDKTNNNIVPGDTNNADYFDNSYFASRDEEVKWLAWMEVQFKKIAGEDGEISLEEFKNALGVKKSFFAERFFTLFDSDRSGSIECDELMVGLRKLTKGTPAEKLKFLFDVYDANESGTIDIDELKTVLRSCMEESSLQLSEDDLDSLTALLFESADEDGSGEISFDELKAELEKHPGVIENLSISAAQWMKPPVKKKQKDGLSRYFTKRYILNNLRKVLFFLLYVLANIGFGIYAGWNYRTSNGFIIAARICGMNLNFNCMFILVLMLRKSLTYLRMTKMGNLLPIDQHILFHKMVGIMIAFYSAVHTIAHLGNAFLLDKSRDDLKLWEILFTTKAGFGWVYDTAILTGWGLDIIVVIMVICSMPFVRRSGHFQVFYWTHMLYVPFWILVIIHGSNFWKWFVAPGLLFILEKLSRSKFIKRARYGNTYIEEITLLPSGVTHLEISRPDNFSYKAGDYLNIQIPAIAEHEWHPFTISSAPEMDGRLWLHVRSAGHWTKKLYEHFENYDPGESEDIEDDHCPMDDIERRRKSAVGSRRKSTIEVLNAMQFVRQRSKSLGFLKSSFDTKEVEKQNRIKKKNKHVKVKCYLDGPYGTATREIFQTEHAILVGAGIGVTPMASILQSIMYRYKESKRTCPKCSHSWFGSIAHTAMKTRKVDFVWINRDQKSFEWFVSLLTNLEIEQSLDNEEEGDSKIIDMHMFMTAAQKKTDMKGIGLQIALDLMHEKSNKDLITGLKTKTQPGRPDWNKLFKSFEGEKKGKIKVFFCGAPQLGKIIKEAAERFSFAFSKENF